MHDTGVFSIKEIETPDELREAQAIRERVFVAEQGIARALDRDGLDASSLHVLARCGGRAAATGRLTLEAGGAGTIARIAVLPAYRGRGLGRLVVARLEDLARREGRAAVSLHAHDYLETFYQSLGYTTAPETTRAGPYRLITMTKRL